MRNDDAYYAMKELAKKHDDLELTWHGKDSSYHLILNEPKKHKVKFWVNVYEDTDGEIYLERADSKEQAKEIWKEHTQTCISDEWIACLEFEREFETGEGL